MNTSQWARTRDWRHERDGGGSAFGEHRRVHERDYFFSLVAEAIVCSASIIWASPDFLSCIRPWASGGGCKGGQLPLPGISDNIFLCGSNELHSLISTLRSRPSLFPTNFACCTLLINLVGHVTAERKSCQCWITPPPLLHHPAISSADALEPEYK